MKFLRSKKHSVFPQWHVDHRVVLQVTIDDLNLPFPAALGHLTAGLVAEASCCVIFVPVDVIKVRSCSGLVGLFR